jgi:hypothetical protein
MTLSAAQFTSRLIITESQTGNDVGGSGRYVIWSATPVYVWRDFEKPHNSRFPCQDVNLQPPEYNGNANNSTGTFGGPNCHYLPSH